MNSEKTLGTGKVLTVTALTLIVFMIGILLRQAKPVLFPFFFGLLAEQIAMLNLRERDDGGN